MTTTVSHLQPPTALVYSRPRDGPSRQLKPRSSRALLRPSASGPPALQDGAVLRGLVCAVGFSLVSRKATRSCFAGRPQYRARREFSRAQGDSQQTPEAPVWLGITRFVVPTYALVVTSMILTAVDKAFIGRVSSLQLASLGPSGAVFDCCSYLLTFLNTATLAFLTSEPEQRHSSIRIHAIVFSVGSGAALGVFLLLLAVPAVRLLGASSAMLPPAVIYLQLRALGAPVDRLGSVCTQFWLAQKDGITPMVATLIAAVFNAGGDYLLCAKYGTAGAAVATVVSSAISAGYLVWRLRARGLWPRPFQWPKWADFKPFAAFAGPVFLILLLKIISFAAMTAFATMLGTAPAAAHQVLVSLFFVSGIAVGQPLSWAAQTYFPGTKGTQRRHTVRALIGVTSAGIVIGSGMCAMMAKCCLSWFTRDALVRGEAMAAAPAVVAFVGLYIGFLSLEGTAIALRKLRMCVIISFLLVTFSGLSMLQLARQGLLTLRTLWAAQTTVLTLATAAMGITVAWSLRTGRESANETE